MTLFSDLLIILRRLDEKIKAKTDHRDWTFVAEELKGYIMHVKAENQFYKGKYEELLNKMKSLYSLTVNPNFTMENRFVLEHTEAIITELKKLI